MWKLKNKPGILVLAVLACGMIIAVAHFQYFDTRAKILELYGEKQVVLAKQIALGIQKYFDERISVLGVLGNYHVDQQLTSVKHGHAGDFIYSKITGGNQLVFFDDRDNLLCLSPDGESKNQQLIDGLNQFVRTTSDSMIKRRASVTIVESRDIFESVVYIMMPVVDRDGRYRGLIAEMINLNKTLQNIITPFMQTFQAHAFILSQQGEILYHPYHPQMTFKRLSDLPDHCSACHYNFDLEQRMLRREQGWGEKEDEGPKKLLSFARIDLPGEKWVVAVKTPYEVISRANRKQFWIFFILSGSMMLVVLLGSTAIYQINRRRIEMEKERVLRQKEHLALIGEMSTRIAHEIKNPLASLQTGIQLIESTLQMNAESHDYFRRLTGEVRRVDGIVKGLLSYAREERLRKAKTDLIALINHVIELIKPTIHNKQINWIVDYPQDAIMACIDEQKMEQVFWNLLINSVQAIEKSGNISVRFNRGNKHVSITIRDDGCGISSEDQKKLFRPYFSTRPQGTGLGLAICKKIIQAHQGGIVVKSKKDVGTEIEITIPEKNHEPSCSDY